MNLCYNKLDYLGGLTMGSNDSKNKFLKFFQDGKFPRFTRIGLDVGWNILLFLSSSDLLADSRSEASD